MVASVLYVGYNDLTILHWVGGCEISHWWYSLNSCLGKSVCVQSGEGNMFDIGFCEGEIDD